MPLPSQHFDADLDVNDALVEVRHVRITHGDELRAELECNKHGIRPEDGYGIAITSVQLWCALTRLGHYPDDYRTFREHGLINYRLIKSDELGEAATVPPTHEAEPTPSASSSPLTSPAPPTGSTPTSTNA